MKKVEIIGGKSTAGWVSIISDEFVATAHSEKNNKITCKVKRNSALARFIYKNKNLPIPRLVILGVLITDSMTDKVEMFFVGLFVLVTILLGIFSQPVPKSSSSLFSEVCFWGLCIMFQLGLLFCFRQSIAKWHGAEHMAIAAYTHTGSTDIQMITRERPIDDQCGGRFILPFLFGVIISNFVAKKFGMNQTIIFFVILECFLWVDKLIGFEKIPVTSQASYFLQKWFTTRHPGKQELRTAQTALRELVNAHKNL